MPNPSLKPSPVQRTVAVILYPGCIFFEVALAVEVLARHFSIRCFTPDGSAHQASNGCQITAAGDFEALAREAAVAVLIPGGNPRDILVPNNLVATALNEQAARGSLMASICAGNLVVAAAGLLRGRSGTHNYTLEQAPPEKVAATRSLWEGMHFVRANIVVDGQFITAQPWAYRQYAAAVGRAAGVLTEAEAYELQNYVVHASYGAA
jgi:transcriptional regulator GlxA family with amidase domain